MRRTTRPLCGPREGQGAALFLRASQVIKGLAQEKRGWDVAPSTGRAGGRTNTLQEKCLLTLTDYLLPYALAAAAATAVEHN